MLGPKNRKFSFDLVQKKIGDNSQHFFEAPHQDKKQH